jgi:hypothetical protein
MGKLIYSAIASADGYVEDAARAAFFTAHHQWLTSAWVLGDLDGLRRQLS